MRTRATNAVPLAPSPDLDQYRKLAKDLLAKSRVGDDAIQRWAHAWIERLARLQTATPTPEYIVPGTSGALDRQQIDREVQGIVSDVRQSRLVASDARPAKPTLSEAQLVVARLHGFESWPRFVRHVESLHEPESSVSQFESAADAIVTGDVARLTGLIRDNPQLVGERSSRDHRATLLHYVAANGHEGFRQRTPKNAVAIARALLEAGGEPDALADMYGNRCTTMEMLVSSTHPYDAGVQSDLVETLLDFGAAVDGPADDGSPLMTALAFHYVAAAETLARRGARIDNLISAAALGRADLVERFVDDEGRLRPKVRLPDVPWPRLPKDPAIHLGYALTWACTFGREEVVDLLLRKGVDPSARDGDATALHFAAAYGRMDLVRRLLAHGASLEMLNSYGGTVLDGTIWFAFNSPVEGVDYAVIVRELIEAGARVDIYPELEANVAAVLAGRRGGGYPGEAALADGGG